MAGGRARSRPQREVAPGQQKMATRRGQGEVVKYRPWFVARYAEGPLVDRSCAHLAASGGHVPVLEWMHWVLWLAGTCTSAAVGGQLETLKWARANYCPWDEETCAAAARHGHLDVLRWVRKQGCPWDATTTAAAPSGGHLRVLKWARAHNCPCDATTRHAARDAGHVEVLRWALANGCP
jgi:hypothetical protein